MLEWSKLQILLRQAKRQLVWAQHNSEMRSQHKAQAESQEILRTTAAGAAATISYHALKVSATKDCRRRLREAALHDLQAKPLLFNLITSRLHFKHVHTQVRQVLPVYPLLTQSACSKYRRSDQSRCKDITG